MVSAVVHSLNPVHPYPYRIDSALPSSVIPKSLPLCDDMSFAPDTRIPIPSHLACQKHISVVSHGTHEQHASLERNHNEGCRRERPREYVPGLNTRQNEPRDPDRTSLLSPRTSATIATQSSRLTIQPSSTTSSSTALTTSSQSHATLSTTVLIATPIASVSHSTPSDLSKLPVSSISPKSSASASSTPAYNPSFTVTPSTSVQDPWTVGHLDLSTGASVGLGVGLGVIGVCLASMILRYVNKWWKKRTIASRGACSLAPALSSVCCKG